MIRTTKPGECMIGCCLPLTKEAFFHLLERNDKSDFLASQFKHFSWFEKELLWNDVYQLFAARISRELDSVAKLGTRVIRNFSGEHLSLISGYEVFTLFGHFNLTSEQVELFDGMYSKDSFVAKLPEFDGIIDLALCYSKEVRNSIKRRFDRQVISFEAPVNLLTAMLIYSQVVTNLARFKINYVDCLINTCVEAKINIHGNA